MIPRWSDLTTTVKLIAGAVALIVIALFAWGVVHMLTVKPKAEARVATNQTQAAQANGTDAVNAVGAANQRETESADLSRTNETEIRHAQGADAAVAAPVRDAGLASLCRRASYRSDPKCLQHPSP